MQRIVDITVPLADATTGSTHGALSMPCLCDADGVRHFFGPLLVRASRMQRAQSLYRKIRNVTTRRVATDDEMAFVRRHHLQLYMRIMRERRLQIDDAARRDTRKRRRRALQKARQMPDAAGIVDLGVPVAREDDEGACRFATPVLIMCDSDDDALEGGVTARPRAFDGGADDKHGGFGNTIVREGRGSDNREQHQLEEEEDKGEHEETCEDDDDKDGDYDADGTDDSIPVVARRQTTGRVPCAAVTASTIYLVEATSRLIEYLGDGLVPPGDAHEPPPNKRTRSARPSAPCQPDRERTWPEIEPAIASWAATRRAAFDATHRDRSRGPTGRSRKQERPLRALLPVP
ncbi:hypothetical protein pkur_cds_739 [Pandoravirus kuranda]|uniref:Uncharacterized protein n=1 Tax=Pandoravirus kuranda TaxID=3019033 RepID=A0AA95EHD4_9VIRU|nr:hypothetical protein pkur_cds_739 [Pandoravirus kuranda]